MRCCPVESPCPDHKKTKAQLIDELTRVTAELAAAKKLLAAIAEMALMPQPKSISCFSTPLPIIEALRDRAIYIAGAAEYPLDCDVPGPYQAAAETLLRHKHDPIPYEIYAPDVESAEVKACIACDLDTEGPNHTYLHTCQAAPC